MAATAPRRPGIDAALAAALCAAVALAYRAAVGNGFLLWDDQLYVTENPLVAVPTWDNLVRLGRTVVALNWHPLTMASLWADARLWGAASAGPFIAVNVALHAANTALVFLLVRRVAGDRLVAAAAALALGLHPMHVESVAWVSGRKDVLFAFFYLLALLCYERRLASGERGWLAAAWGAFALSCLAKAVAVSLPLALLLLDAAAGRPLKSVRPWLEKVPFFALALLVGAIAFDVQGGGNAGGWLAPDRALQAFAQGQGYPFTRRVEFAAWGACVSLVKFFVPHPLSGFHPYPTPAELRGAMRWPLAAAPLVFAALWAGALAVSRRTRVPLLCLAFFTLTLAPVSQIVTVGRALTADRYTYLPYLGPAIAAGALGASLVRRRLLPAPAAWGALALVAVVWGALAFRQTGVWRNDETFWGRVVELYPDAAVPRVVRGHAYGKAGRFDLAIRDFERARAAGFESADLYEGLGNAYGSLGEPARALPLFDRALALDPGSGSILANRGIARMALGDPAAAAVDFTAALARLPGSKAPAVLRLRAQARLQLGDAAGAAADEREALRLAGTPR